MSLLLINARTLTLTPDEPGPSSTADQALLIEEGWIAGIGPTGELRRDHPGVEEIDLGGALLMPGWTDSHTHFYEWARKLAGVDLEPATDLDDVKRLLIEHRDRIGARIASWGGDGSASSWIGGSGWDPGFYGQRQQIDRHFLDAIFPDRPVLLEARDFHTFWVNSQALEAAGLLDADVDAIEVPQGGRVGRGTDGKPDGLLYESAWKLIWAARPPEPYTVARAWLEAATREAHALGLTGLHTMEPESTLDHLRRLAAEDQLRLRICFHTPVDQLQERIARGERGYTDLSPFLRLGGVKTFMDGSLGSRSARMLEPYPDGSRGTLTGSVDQLEEQLTRAAEAGIPGAVHAIGDATVRIVTDVLVRLREKYGPDLAHRIEHAQCVRDEEIARLARARITCAMQPVHLMYDGPHLDREWGAASRLAYRCRDLVDAGVPITLGSDAPVAPLDPRPGIAMAISRVWQQGQPPHQPAQALTPVEALHGYTLGPAIAAGRQHELGSLQVGMLADLTAVDDVLDEDPSTWLDAKVRLTVVDGRVLFSDL